MLDTTSTRTDLMPALIQFSGMVFGAVPPDQALQVVAKTLGVTTVAVGRIATETGQGRILAQNTEGLTVRAGWTDEGEAPNVQIITLTKGAIYDVLVVNSATKPLSFTQRETLIELTPYVVAFWAARKASFDNALASARIEASESVLHPDNPYGLTRSELRVCHLIAQGHRPKAMAERLGKSMTTIRTHLRHIYTKTGLDGMFSVLHHLQQFAQFEQKAK